jgi:hypothetical protein
MNERIRELAVQAGFTVEDGHIQSLAYKQTEKLAELIVRECVETVKQSQWTEAKGEYYEGFNEAMNYASIKIKKHFGVE